jgi:hypothetical protein
MLRCLLRTATDPENNSMLWLVTDMCDLSLLPSEWQVSIVIYVELVMFGFISVTK